jgi:undecaprenyl-diphosphatase
VVRDGVETLEQRDLIEDSMKLSWKTALGIGLWQCLSIIPGVSRSGATIVGGLLLGVDKKAAAEFSFFLAIPTMVGAFTLDFWESREMITNDVAGLIAIGFVVSFISGLFVVRFLVDFVGRFGFAPFSAWRILVGTVGLLAIWLY